MKSDWDFTTELTLIALSWTLMLTLVFLCQQTCIIVLARCCILQRFYCRTYFNWPLWIPHADVGVPVPTDVHCYVGGVLYSTDSTKELTLIALSWSLMLTLVFLCQQTCIVVLAGCCILHRFYSRTYFNCPLVIPHADAGVPVPADVHCCVGAVLNVLILGNSIDLPFSSVVYIVRGT